MAYNHSGICRAYSLHSVAWESLVRLFSAKADCAAGGCFFKLKFYRRRRGNSLVDGAVELFKIAGKDAS